METVRTVADLRDRVARWRDTGAAVGFTPTLGALHEGHLSLVDVARGQAQRVVASIFVNPTQFGEDEDLDAYPRDEAADAAMLKERGCDLLYAPTVEEMYPPGFATQVLVRGVTEGLCGAMRPGHMDGVAQVVTKLLLQALPDLAVFGEKDWQQLVVIRRLVRDLDIPTRIVGAPIVREADGLAMSSRNRYLNAEQRKVAARLNEMLARTAVRVIGGGRPAEETEAARRQLLQAGFDAVDYVELRTAETLEPVERYDPAVPTRIFGAAHLGRARLIDNMPVQ